MLVPSRVWPCPCPTRAPRRGHRGDCLDAGRSRQPGTGLGGGWVQGSWEPVVRHSGFYFNPDSRQLSEDKAWSEVTPEQSTQTGVGAWVLGVGTYSDETDLGTQMKTNSGNGLRVSFSSFESLGVWTCSLCMRERGHAKRLCICQYPRVSGLTERICAKHMCVSASRCVRARMCGAPTLWVTLSG